MIDLILESLEITRSKHINVLILKGLYKLPQTIEDGKKQLEFKKHI